MIKTRSTYEVEFNLSLTNDVLIEVFIWSGLQSAKPSEASYEFTVTNPLDELTSKIDISSLVNDYIEPIPNIATATSLINANSLVWVSVDRTEDVTTTNLLEDLASIGYGYATEGINTDKPTNNILLTGNEFDVSRDSTFIIPIYTDGGDVTATSYPNNEINFSETTVASTDSNELLKHLVLDISETTTDEYIEVVYNNTTITVFIKEECKYTPLDIHFINKEGAQQVITFFKEQKHKTNIDSEQYERSGISIISGEHQFKEFNKNSKSSFKVNSGFVFENMNETFRQLLLSELVWVYQEDNFIPLNVESKSLDYKTRLNDRLIRYNIEFGYSFNDI